MTGSLEQSLGAWQGFYTFLGTVAATLLGLLFVALSLRLNIFHEAEVRDVRDFALHTLGNFFCLILVAGVILVPHQTRLGVGLPLALLGLAGIAGLIYVARESYRMNAGANPLTWWAVGSFVLGVLTYLGLTAVGVLLLGGQTGALGWLVVVDAVLLTTATLSAWLLLSHAKAS